MRKIAHMLILMLPLILACTATAKPQIVSWSWPTTDCEGATLAQSDLVESELIFDLAPMPMPSDSDGPCAVTNDPDSPAGAVVVPIDIADTSTILNLKPGETYFARIRVASFVLGNWSVWSSEHQFTVPYGRPNRVIISAAFGNWEADLIEDPVIRLN